MSEIPEDHEGETRRGVPDVDRPSTSDAGAPPEAEIDARDDTAGSVPAGTTDEPDESPADDPGGPEDTADLEPEDAESADADATGHAADDEPENAETADADLTGLVVADDGPEETDPAGVAEAGFDAEEAPADETGTDETSTDDLASSASHPGETGTDETSTDGLAPSGSYAEEFGASEAYLEGLRAGASGAGAFDAENADASEGASSSEDDEAARLEEYFEDDSAGEPGGPSHDGGASDASGDAARLTAQLDEYFEDDPAEERDGLRGDDDATALDVPRPRLVPPDDTAPAGPSFDETSFDDTAFDNTSFDDTAFDATSFDNTSFDDTAHDDVSHRESAHDRTDGDAAASGSRGADETIADADGAGLAAAASAAVAASGTSRSASGGPAGPVAGGSTEAGEPAGPGSGGPGGPRKGASGPSGRRPGNRRAKYARRACYVLGVLLLIPVVGFIVVYLMTPIPSTTQPAAKAQQSVFYYSDGKTVIARSGEFDRRPVQLSAVPRPVSDAVISAENRSFYSDSGVSVKGSARAVWATLTGGSLQGGSTITQQMVRNYYSGLSQQRTASRKLKEIMIALKVGREKNKDWILQQYLNTIYFGRDAYGIESAAQAYYGKDVQQLTPTEGAYLAAAIQVPTFAGDLSVPGARGYMQARWKYVLDGMVQMQTITAQQAATMTFPEPHKQPRRSIYAGSKGYMVVQAKAELRRMHYTDNQINMGGLKVRTTFDKDLMADAKQAVESNLPAGTPKKVMVGLMAIDPANGEVTAFYGGRNYIDQSFDSAFDAKVQAGSGFKPYVLAAALKDGETLNTYVDGSSPQTFAGTPIHNDQNENFGLVNLVTATQDSINTAYINLGQKIGLDKVVATAEDLGIPSSQLEAAKDAPVLPLGVADVSVEQQAAAYAAFASEGTYHAPHVLKSVTDRDGKVRKPDEHTKKVFSATVARDATYAMQRVVDAGTGVNASLPDRNAAGKTGTTSDGKQIWFNGFIPQMAASVGIFRSDNKPLNIPGYSSYGGELPAQIWRSYIEQADRGLPARSFGAPSISPPTRPVTPVTPPRPRPTGPRRVPTPIIPSHGPPTGPPTGPPPTGPPTGPPASPLSRHEYGFPDTSG